MAIPPTRAAALKHLAAFAPRMGRDYAQGRNTDPGPGKRRDVSELSPHIRHRLISEEEVVRAALAHHTPQAAEKFIQEVFWRSYWKGYLELRPAMWADYRARARTEHARLQGNAALAQAMQGQTGIACFDAWARELAETGYLHNHARMWFASIWIFTLRLPWVLGADFFLQHLLDADAASNTLSWRWVAGIQTSGKHYLARAENIARYTQGRFDPRGELNEAAAPLDEPGPPPAGALPPGAPPPRGRVALLLHDDDVGFWPEGCEVAAVAGLCFPAERSMAGAASPATAFTQAALADGLHRAGERAGVAPQQVALEDIAEWAQGLPVVMPWTPVGWTAEMLAGQPGSRRAWDSICWPLARAGFFPFKARIPAILGALSPDASDLPLFAT